MSRTDFESRAYRRRVAVMLTAFLLGLLGLFALTVYLLLVYFRPAQGWFDTVMFLLQLLPFMLIGAGGFAMGMSYLVDLPDLLRGRFRCERCGRVAGRRTLGLCQCEFPARPRRPKRHWVHYRRRLAPVLLLNGGILGVVLIFLGTRSAPRPTPFIVDAVVMQAVSCVLVAAVLHLLIALLEVVKRGRRWRLRAGVFMRMLVVWPFAVIVVMLIREAME